MSTRQASPNERGSGAAAPAATPAQSGWLGQLFGQCCRGDTVEPEVRIGEDDQWARKDNGPKTRSSRKEGAQNSNLTRRYLIDNRILQVVGSPGIAYRYTKNEDHRVKNEETCPAKWGEIVEGIDEGDGWLKVGKYFLPMKHRGILAITPVEDSAAAQPERKPCAGRYLIDNSILQIASRPGLAYRYTKSNADKVKNERGPAKWGEIVEGIDGGDGWLKVGQYYLPMIHEGTPVITPVQESGEVQAKPKRRVEWASNPATPAPAPAPEQAVDKTAAAAKSAAEEAEKKGLEQAVMEAAAEKAASEEAEKKAREEAERKAAAEKVAKEEMEREAREEAERKEVAEKVAKEEMVEFLNELLYTPEELPGEIVAECDRPCAATEDLSAEIEGVRGCTDTKGVSAEVAAESDRSPAFAPLWRHEPSMGMFYQMIP